jgi:hypothetical protein
LATASYGFLNVLLLAAALIAAVCRGILHRSDALQVQINGEVMAFTHVKHVAAVLKWLAEHRSAAPCRGARPRAETGRCLGTVKSNGQAVFLRQEIGRGKAFDHAHDVLAARTRMARCSWSDRIHDCRRHGQQLAA